MKKILLVAIVILASLALMANKTPTPGPKPTKTAPIPTDTEVPPPTDEPTETLVIVQITDTKMPPTWTDNPDVPTDTPPPTWNPQDTKPWKDKNTDNDDSLPLTGYGNEPISIHPLLWMILIVVGLFIFVAFLSIRGKD